MEVRPATGDDTAMLRGSSSSDPGRAVPASARELQRAAGALQRDAGSAKAVASLPATVAHVEEALDRLAIGVERMACAVAEWGDTGSNIVDDDALPPDARALRWHLRATAHALRSSRDACSVTREWARRLLDAGDDAMVPGAARDDIPARASAAASPRSHPS